ncbi:MAG: hypothetical protein IPI67_02205 [Myxococcales bacterium]|nr:hypothetical protein [Myxococcales bacterium]
MLNRFSEAIERAGVDVVPRVVVGGGNAGTGGGLLETMLAVLMSAKLVESPLSGSAENPRSPELELLRTEMLRDTQRTPRSNGRPSA